MYIEWEPPAVPNGRIRYYRVEYHFANDPSNITMIETASPVTHINITGLRPWTYYIYRVAGFTTELGEYIEGSIETQQGCK